METPNGRVRWSLWSSGFGFVTQGQMQLCKVTEKLQKFEHAAKQLLAQTGADHVVYGRKIYDEDGKVKEVRFYLEPMTDKRFERDVVPLKNQVIYALHKLGEVPSNE